MKVTVQEKVLKVKLDTKQGVPGAPGLSESQTFNQSSPATEWTVNHNLARKPMVDVYSVGGVVLDAQIVHISDNQFKVYFTAATAGYAVYI
jgi:hypothetical protein